ncbi:HAMP domain-containing protein [Brevibacillus sp. HB1.1]|uniref:adenylate/guanylate cyclase domain-containing protein n=1 Tax=Brevibacillus sp. HB1.1 TaxID=2738808 RepID=UPI001576C64A|nr:adenylate/guanylate cyclase domain-containing protein [Brevibacillus sp. HB1.1]NTU32808.1 HAMP domain-containing protein [Brevibacillus sp. HB1.1]
MGNNKKYSWLSGLLIVFVGIGLLLVWNVDRSGKQGVPFRGIDSIAVNSQKDVILITDGHQKLISLSPDRSLRYQQVLEQNPEEGLENFTEVAIDEEGYAYVLITKLDSFGLRTVSERIVRMSPDGEIVQVVYEDSYGANSSYKRIGKVRSLQVAKDRLSFYVYQHPEVIAYQFVPSDSPPTQLYQIQLPNEVYVNEITGVDPQHTYVTTKRGEVFQVDVPLGSREAQVKGPLYIHSERSEKNHTVPNHVKVGPAGRLLFYNSDQNVMERFDPAHPDEIALMVSSKTFEQIKSSDSSALTAFAVTPNYEFVVATDSQLAFLDQQGNVMTKLTSPSVSEKDRLKEWTWWTGLGVEILLFCVIQFLLFRLFRIPLIIKQTIVIAPLVVVPVFLQLEGTKLTFSFMEQENQTDLRLQAYVISTLIEGDKLDGINGAIDYMNADYQAVQADLKKLEVPDDVNVNRGLYKTIYKYKDGELFLMMDDNDSAEVFENVPIDDEFRSVVMKREIVSGKAQDRTGYWMYAMAPIYNSSGKLSGVLELGREMNGVRMQHTDMSRELGKGAALVWSICASLFFLFSWLTYRNIRNLQTNVSDMGKGDYSVVARVRSMDEIQKLAESFNQMAKRIRQYISNITRMSEANNRFVPQQFIHFLGKESILDVELGDQVEREMAIMRMSLQSFHAISHRLRPETTFRVINAFLKRFAPIVNENQGMITEYLDPGVLAVYPKEAKDALDAAVQMRRTLADYNEQRAEKGYDPIELRVALHHGPLMLGIIGESTRLEAAIISDHVRVVEKMEKMAETLGACILMSDSLFAKMGESTPYRYRDLGWVHMEGEAQPMHLYDVYEGDTDQIRAHKEETKELFEQAIVMYQNGRFHDARSAFLSVIKQNRWDQAARQYFYLCDEYAQKGAERDWSGELKIS